MPEIFIHIGLHKTGTTALQTFLAANEEAFNQAGVYFPKATRDKKVEANHSFKTLVGTFEQL